MGDRASHRSEQTGNPALDRMQNNVRDAIAKTNSLLLALARTHGVGVRRVRMTDANYTLTSEDIEGAVIIFTGTLTAGRDVLVPRATDTTGFARWFENATGQTLTFRNADGSATLPALTGTGFYVVSADGPVGYT